jgi:hypothetical protein
MSAHSPKMTAKWFSEFDYLTCRKAREIHADGKYAVSGVVMRHVGTGDVCIVEYGAVRWLGKEEAWKLMHPDTK